jgi:proteasome lid subunit RPN8/RPN11
VTVLLDLSVVDRLATAVSAKDAEIGGLLIGRFEDNYNIINDFETIESEHKRGMAYTLSARDASRMGARIEKRFRSADGEVVGFFRSHRRPGLYLDEADRHIVSSYFADPKQVVLLIKAESNLVPTGGFFFWEEGEMNRKQTYLTFPMNARELELGDFRLVEPVAPSYSIPESLARGATASAGLEETNSVFDKADTVDNPWTEGVTSARERTNQLESDQRAWLKQDPQLTRNDDRQRPIEQRADDELPPRTLFPPPVRTAKPPTVRTVLPPRQKRLHVLAIIAAAAALGGYLIGALQRRDNFGDRAGDITLNTKGQDGDTSSTAVPKTPPSNMPNPQPQLGAGPASIGTPPNSAARTSPALPGAGVTGQPPKYARSSPLSSPNASGPSPAKNSPFSAKRPATQAPVVNTGRNPATAQNMASRDTVPQRPAHQAPPPPSPTRQNSNSPETVAQTRPMEEPGVANPQTYSSAPSSAPIPVPQQAEPPARPADEARSPARAEPKAIASVYLEAVEDSGVRRALKKIPWIGSLQRDRYHGGEGYAPPQALRTPAPAVPFDVARDLPGPVGVDLKLKVDESGRVQSVELLSGDEFPGLVRLAGDAAYEWQFHPAQLRERPVPSGIIAHFRFRLL